MPSSRDVGPGRPRPTPAAAAVVDGWRRVLRAPAVTLGVLLVTFLLALPLAATLGAMIEEHLGASLAADDVAAGWDAGWAAEFAAGAQGIGRTFGHEIIGFGGTLAILSGLADREALNPALAGAVAAYLLIWLFLWGGILDRLARGRRIGAAAFFSACGAWFFRFLRLAVPVAAAWWWLFDIVHPLLFEGVYGRLTRNLTSEPTAAAIRLGLYAVFFASIGLVRLVSDFARVRAVVEDRRSMVGAVLAGVRFMRRRPARVLTLYLLNGVALALVVTAWYLLAPGASSPPAVAFLLAQVYLLGRLWVRLAIMASAIAFFQAELAHAGYTAARLPVWPDSPAVEAIDHLAR
jgi:hypothetical protein